jgi:hypothetical protein
MPSSNPANPQDEATHLGVARQRHALGGPLRHAARRAKIAWDADQGDRSS